ncbi:Protein FRA10AC1 [Bienertia sinuspersici]
MAYFNSLKSAIFDREERKQHYQAHIRGLNAYEKHKKFLNDYIKYYGKERPAEQKLPIKTDQDALREGYRRDDMDTSWEQRLVKRYYDKLFKEYPFCDTFKYCIADMSKYKSGKVHEISHIVVGLRWRTEKEVMSGKGNPKLPEKTDKGPENHPTGWAKSARSGSLQCFISCFKTFKIWLRENRAMGGLGIVVDVVHLLFSSCGLFRVGWEVRFRGETEVYCRVSGVEVLGGGAGWCCCQCGAVAGNKIQRERERQLRQRQFICGNKHCDERDGLASFEVNFSYVEAGENKQALVKLVACESCAEKLHYRRNKEREREESQQRDDYKRNRKASKSDDEVDDEGNIIDRSQTKGIKKVPSDEGGKGLAALILLMKRLREAKRERKKGKGPQPRGLITKKMKILTSFWRGCSRDIATIFILLIRA